MGTISSGLTYQIQVSAAIVHHYYEGFQEV